MQATAEFIILIVCQQTQDGTLTMQVSSAELL
jgi:hypothetical protein